MGIRVIAYKCGMTRFFTSSGLSIPVTVIKIYKNYIIDIKLKAKKQYCLKVSACFIKDYKLSKSLIGIYKKIGLDNLKYMHEFCIEKNEINGLSIGDEIPTSIFANVTKLNISGVSKGKGFAGVVKRYNFSMQRATHGNSLSHRVPGSIGQCQDPGKVFKGKKMAGRLGGTNVTIKNLDVINLYTNKNIILLKGAVPGFPGSKVILKKCL